MKIQNTILQFTKYGLVGVSNTMLTLGVIYLLSNLLNIHYMTANAIGYAAGFINSFILNRTWTFAASKENWQLQFFKFLIVFGICYSFQLGFLYLLVHQVGISENIAQLAAMIFYTAVSFIINKAIVFSNHHEKESHS